MQADPCAPEDVLAFWRQAGPSRWFTKDAAFDAEFKRRFEAAHVNAADGHLDKWRRSAEGTLALSILLDQFPRNAYRDSPRRFSTDGAARAVANGAIEAGFDREVEPAFRRFFYLPFMHSEAPADQARSVELNALQDENTQRSARLHRDIIERFGRFPHRNAILGRASSDAERDFLDHGGFAG
ncbi:MAG: DUF924 family protein [Variovorax sp.]